MIGTTLGYRKILGRRKIGNMKDRKKKRERERLVYVQVLDVRIGRRSC
jgi:hypothetical protein